jgi:effector-binding domain-containing protein
MIIKPTLVNRSAQPYCAFRVHLHREAIGETVPSLFIKIYGWLASNNIEIKGPSIIRYLMVDYNSGEVQIDAGVPIASLINRNDSIQSDVIPGGLYATVLHQGEFSGLMETTGELLEWGKENHISWQVVEKSNIYRWRGRIETYLVGPSDTPDSQEWKTEISILLAERREKKNSVNK